MYNLLTDPQRLLGGSDTGSPLAGNCQSQSCHGYTVRPTEKQSWRADRAARPVPVGGAGIALPQVPCLALGSAALGGSAQCLPCPVRAAESRDSCLRGEAAVELEIWGLLRIKVIWHL